MDKYICCVCLFFRLFFPLLDQTLHLFLLPGVSSVCPFLAAKFGGPMLVALLQITVFLVVREPTYILACIICLISLLFSFFFLLANEQRTLTTFLTIFVSFLFIAFTSRAFYIRLDLLTLLNTRGFRVYKGL